MSDEIKESSGQPEQSTSGVVEGNQEQHASGNDVVKYETYKKVLAEKKQRDKQLAELEQRLNQLESEKMEKEGNVTELLEKWKNQAETYKSKVNELNKNYAYAQLTAQVKSQAAQMGVRDKALDDLIKVMNLSDIPVDPETFQADNDNIKMMLTEMKKDRPYFFSSQSLNVHDVDQQNKVQQKPAVDFSKMSRDELMDYVKKNGTNL